MSIAGLSKKLDKLEAVGQIMSVQHAVRVNTFNKYWSTLYIETQSQGSAMYKETLSQGHYICERL